MNNPLLTEQHLPRFDEIEPQHIEPAIDHLLTQQREQIDALLKRDITPTFENFVRVIDAMSERLNRVWSPVSHINAVVNSPALRQSYNNCLPKISEFFTELGQNEALYQAYKTVAQSDEYQQLDVAARKMIDNALRDFRLSGVALEADKKDRYKEIKQELSRLTSKFEENVLDATGAWKKGIDRIEDLSGLPESALALARQAAKQASMQGWQLSLEAPSYLAVMTYADGRALRREVYEAYTTRASELGPHARHWDNTNIMQDLLALRHEQAQLLGFDNYAKYSLATKMANTPDEVLGFLNDLAQRSHAVAEKEFAELAEFSKTRDGMTDLSAWDILYYSEKLREDRYAISQEELKAYFPVAKVLTGMFAVVERLYGLHIEATQGVATWHPDVQFFQIRDEHNELRGEFYLDLYARADKRGGAWMDECVTRMSPGVNNGDDVDTPVTYLTCNFTPPLGDAPSLLTHSEVITLFHEFGHGLHHMLTKVEYAGVAGIRGVAWDAVELPSQFMENWCWQREALDLISGHYQTGETLPNEMYQKLYASKNFLSGMQMVRQLEFALFDFRIYSEYDPESGIDIAGILKQVRSQVAVVPAPDFNRFANGFSHIFAGGYSAGYYSYKWAEVLSSDAFSKFEENGIFDRVTGQQFLSSVLEQGGSREPMELFVEFRGRKPSIDALLRHSGLAA
ncbi:MAG: oligopeptidase A [Gammaproteobacteria bacterium]|nr:oligopeptidase A [Gammaproteobacteria bacterium]